MGKNAQRNLSEVNLGNETYDRGLADGMAGRPKSIKKTHRHAHRYHIGYRQGQRQRPSASDVSVTQGGIAVTVHGHGSAQLRSPSGLTASNKRGLLTRIWGWIKS